MGWTFFWLMVLLKIPILALALIVWWAIRAEVQPVADTPSDEDSDDGGGSKVPESHRVKPRKPRRPRGPHGSPTLPSPPRVRHRVTARSSERHSLS